MENELITNERELQIKNLFTAELQFRLASAVSLATTFKNQPLDVPIEWTHSKQTIKYGTIALRQKQAEYASSFFDLSSTFMMALAMRSAIQFMMPDAQNSKVQDIRAAHWISVMLRNAFAHNPFQPTWKVDRNCRNQILTVKDIIEIDTTNLHGETFQWHHCGGPLAVLLLCRFIRSEILKDDVPQRKIIPMPTHKVRQIGNLFLQQIDKIPEDAVQVEIESLADGGIPIGDGFVIYPGQSPEDES
jgi:hypothetical protein